MNAISMKKPAPGICTLFSLLLLTINSLGQHSKVQGLVRDQNGKPVGLANVTLLKLPLQQNKANTVTDSAGSFSLTVLKDTGNYVLKISALGYSDYKSVPFTLHELQPQHFDVVVQQEEKALKDVTVTALRPLIEQKADKMVITIEGTAMAAGNNAFNVLSKTPGVFVDAEGNIQLNGRSGVMVMIDGRQTYLSARDLRNLLESMNAENIKNIEVITNPSSKYEAEGASGILNINLRKNTQSGINGSVYSTWSYNFKQHNYSLGSNLSFKQGKWNGIINADFSRRAGGREATFTRVFYAPGKTTYFDQYATGNFSVIGPPSVRSGADYAINDKHSVGFLFNYTRNTAESDFLTDTYIGNQPNTPNQYVEADNYNTNTYENYTANLHYTFKLDTVGSLITTDVDHVKIRNVGSGIYNNYFSDITTAQKSTDFLYTYIPNGFDISSARIDLVKQLNKEQQLETGLRVSKVETDNDAQFYFNNAGLVLDPNRSNHFKYTEEIYAAYANWKGNLSKKLSVQMGLRVERTNSTGNSLTLKQITKRHYTDFFPTLFVQQKVNDNYGINLSYSRRLNRPNYGSLNSFKAYRDPYTWYEGNPYLRPQYTHSVSLAQTFKKIYILTVSYQLTSDMMSEVPILDEENAVTVYTTGNVDDAHNIGVTGIVPVKLSGWWDTQNTLQTSFNQFSMQSVNGKIKNEQLFYMLQSNHTINISKDTKAELSFVYRGPAASGLYRMAPMSRVDIGIRKSFLDKKLELSINANDIFKGYRYLWTTDINGNVNDFDQYFRFRNIGVTLRFNFSKGQKVETKSRSAVEEVNRT